MNINFILNDNNINMIMYSLTDHYTNGFNIEFLGLFSFLCIIFSIFTIISKNPVLSLLFLISLFSSISLYLIFIGITFIGLSYLLVYIGAISMLFLFVLMLLDIRISELHLQTNNSIFLGFLIGMLFYMSSFNINSILNKYINKYIYIGNYNSWDGYIIENYDIISIGNILYTNLSIWLIVTSLILLLAMVGAIIININNR